MKTKYTKFIILFLFIAVFVYFFIPSNSYAFDLSNPLKDISAPSGSLSSPESIIETVVNAIITVSQIAFVLMFLIGGVMYLTSMGNEEQMGKARKLLLAAIIGIVVVFAAWGVATWILSSIQQNNSSTTGNTVNLSNVDKITAGQKVNDTVKTAKDLDKNNPVQPSFDDFIIDDSVIPESEKTTEKQECLYKSSQKYQFYLQLCDWYYTGENIDTEGSRNCVNKALEDKRAQDQICNNLTN